MTVAIILISVLASILLAEVYHLGLIEGEDRGYDEAIRDYEEEYRRALNEL